MNAPARLLLSEANLLDDRGDVDVGAFLSIATHRARIEHAAYVAIDPSWTYVEVFLAEVQRLWGTVEVMRECRNARAAVAELPEAEQRARQREFKITNSAKGWRDMHDTVRNAIDKGWLEPARIIDDEGRDLKGWRFTKKGLARYAPLVPDRVDVTYVLPGKAQPT